MATTIRNIAVSVTANTRRFDRGMSRAATRMQRFRSAVVRSAKRVAAFGVAVGAVAAVALVAIVRRTAEAIDKTTKLGKALGVTFNTLKAYSLAASEAGIEQTKLEQAIKRMVKGVSDANNGLSTAVRAFDALGLTSDDLIKLKPDEIFERIADQVKATGKSVQTTGAIMDIFGSRVGVNLLPLLEQGSEVLKASRKEIEKLGLGMTQLDTSKVEQMNDAVNKAKEVFVGVAQQLTAGLAPTVERIATAFIEWATGAKGATSGAVQLKRAAAALNVELKALQILAFNIKSLFTFGGPLSLATVKTSDIPKILEERSQFEGGSRGFTPEKIGTLRLQRNFKNAQNEGLSPEERSAAFLERILARIEGRPEVRVALD